MNEEYYCQVCECKREFFEVNRNWKCPSCSAYVSIKIQVADHLHACKRVALSDLGVGELVTLENRYIREVLDISRVSNQYRIALKEYGVIWKELDDQITMIDGGWFRS